MNIGEQGIVNVKIHEGKNLIALDKNGTSDPYCVVSIGNIQKRTKIVKKCLNPKWENFESDYWNFLFNIDHIPQEIIFEIFDWNQFFAHKRMGRAKVTLKDILDGQEYKKWLKLSPVKDKDEVSGEIYVTIQLKKLVNIDYQNDSQQNINSRKNTRSHFDSFSSTGKNSSIDSNYSPLTFSHSFDLEVEDELFTAIKNSDLDKVVELIKNPDIDVNKKDKYGYTPLHAACCIFSDVDDQILVAILKHPKINVNIENDDKNTPLHYFCQKFRSPNCSEAFDIFIEKGANVNAQNFNGETPLHKAIFNNSVRILMTSLLIKAGADINKVNSQGETPLHYAVRLGREDLVNILLKGGADIDIKGTKKKTPCELAIEEKHEKMAFLLNRAKDLFEWLNEIEMSQYRTLFIKEEIYKELIPDLNEKILDKIGITNPEHREKLLRASKSLKQLSLESPTNFENTKKEENNLKPLDIETELEQLKYVNRTGTWILHTSEIEFTVKLGSGASGTVYKGLYKGKEVAIKVLNTEQTRKELEEFKKEFQIMSTIQSPYVVFFFGACLEPKMCMVMELCSLGSLYHVMNNSTYKIGWDKVFSISKEMVKGVDYLHSYNPQVLHRDFKSLNLMVNDQWHVKVADFGLSRFNTDTQKETLAKMRGTFAYCAPEIYFGAPFSSKSDVFSISIVLWELIIRCITGKYQRPYQEYPNLHFDFQIIIQTAKKELRPTIPIKCPTNFCNLIKTCWDPDPSKRLDCIQIVEKLEKLEQEYHENIQEWENLIETNKE